jgi:UDPglucose 6-dehydrogenase
MREAPSLVLIDLLLGAGARINVFDPEAMKEAKRLLGERVHFALNALGACEGADVLLLVTEWSEFRHIDLDELKKLLKQPVLFDGRNIWDAERARAQGFVYYGVGIR